MAADVKIDRFSIWPISVAIGTPVSFFAEALLLSFQDDARTIGGIISVIRMLYWFLVAPPVLIMSIVFAFIGVYLVWHRRWRRTISFSLLPTVVFCAAIWPMYVFS